MRLGIIADIHEQIDHLRRCLSMLQQAGVDQIITLGDTLDGFGDLGSAAEVVRLLAEADAIGVWGNHDIGLCHQVTDDARRLYEPSVLDFMTRMQPRLTPEDCHFSHLDPWLNPYSVEDLWYFDEPPATPEAVTQSFTKVPHRYIFVGHYHRWLAMTPGGRIDWNEQDPLPLDVSDRYFIAVGAVRYGHSAVFDTSQKILIPMKG